MKISIIGSGNIATFFAIKLMQEGNIIHQIISEKVNRASELAYKVNAQVVVNLTGLDDNIDALFVAIPDDEIKKINLHVNTVVIHCSGTCQLVDVEKYSTDVGCIWPIYSITKNNLPNHKNIPFVINYNTNKAKMIVEQIANCLSNQVQFLNDEQKKIAHLTATISNNFSNHLFTIAHDICVQNNIPFALLIPILELTIHKLNTSSPANNQTGPALRGDKTTMDTHLALLANDTKMQELYEAMSAMIAAYHPQ
jgi:predicted short-subunit dehydrogenase-like oxidoreductase (DUF2520 family)